MGALVPSNMKIGLIKAKGRYYGFCNVQMASRFSKNPDRYVVIHFVFFGVTISDHLPDVKIAGIVGCRWHWTGPMFSSGQQHADMMMMSYPI